MSKNGHYVRIKRPTGPELYRDAARILEELLERKLDDRLYPPRRPKRNITDPFPSGHWLISHGAMLDERDEIGLDDGIERSNTMPSWPRPSRDEKLKQSELDDLHARYKERRDRTGSDSSADTEGDGSVVSERNRKKKSLFRKAKDRLIHAFHRQEREIKMKVTVKGKDAEKDSPKKSSPRKKTSPKGSHADKDGAKSKSPQKGSAVGGSEGDSHSIQSGSGKHRFTVESKDANQASQVDMNGKHRDSAGIALLNSIRKSFRRRKKDQQFSAIDNSLGVGDDLNKTPSKGGQHPGSKSGPFPRSQASDKSSTPSPHREASVPAPPPPRSSDVGLFGLNVPGGSAHDKSPSPFPHSTSTDSFNVAVNRSSSLDTYISAGSRNVLDDPGDDIEYMDAYFCPDGRRPVVNGDAGKDTSGPQGCRGGVPHLDHQCSLVVDGDTDDDKPDGKSNIPFHERTNAEKEAMYSEVAQKLISIGDNYAKSKDTESYYVASSAPNAAGGDAQAQADLVCELTSLLRELGDKVNHKIDGAAEMAVEEVKVEVYDRFKSTVQHALGNEVTSWDQVAFFFYTARGVVSAVGKGSQLANTAKEMTLRYFSDKFAQWIMDRGGFDSVLGDSESDSNLE